MTQNTLADLNNHLFAQLERLSDEEIQGEQLVEEMNRAKTITAVANQIINNGNLILRAMQFEHDHKNNKDLQMPKMLEGNKK